MKFLITGGAGFIGSHIARALISENKCKPEDITVFDNLSVGKEENIPKGCKFIKGDLKNKEEIMNALKGIDLIFHNAAFVSIRGSFEKLREEIDTNCSGTLNVFEACLKNKVKKVVFASSMAVYGEPINLPVDEKHPLNTISPYGLSKIRGEMYCRIFEEQGIDYVILRYFNTYGTKQTPSPYVGVITTFINQAIDKKPITIYGDGNQTRDFIWVEDIAKANLLAAFSKKNGVYNVASGTEISINQIAEKIIESIGGGKEYLPNPFGEITRIKADISLIKKDLGFKPVGKVLEKISELVDFWRKQKK
ncbi:MAG: NAD-dependent epimerase/dehydratase family protein [archaeon]